MSFIIRVPDEISLEVACMVPCSAITAYSAVTKLKQSVQEALEIRGMDTVTSYTS